MAMAFTNLSRWLWSGKHQEPRTKNVSSINSSAYLNAWESDILRFPLIMQENVGSSTRRAKRKLHSREDRKKIDKEFDVVLVPPDGGCVSDSESDDSDFSIGWLEPHGPGFTSDDEKDNNFAVLVPCYGRDCGRMVEGPKSNLLSSVSVGKFPHSYSDESKKYVENWLSSL
ncbi:hypothetical protein Lalb_Chr17g0344551 [Lupinus albus]|uniref:Uncharacterized protein n=1 Tax=Lupinus albus TaxID=3870 RepID=A0A6A4P969_LUPAL|nr:hypothetical protein Lalb_Chr17g0344551 [Lupinus albus]